MSALQKAFPENWNKKGFQKLKAPHLLAVSGGKDSMALAHLLLSSKVDFAVAHCNFKLRGEDANGDETFVKTFAEKHNLPFFSVAFDTQNISAARKTGIQETARSLRYEWLENVRAENNYGSIITAHHADDNAETLLINLLRGTGIAGLHGIREHHEKLLRPLLFATREMIDAYAAENKIDFREDASNAGDKYLRNAIRHKVIPAFKEIMPDAIVRLNDNIHRFAEAEILYQKALQRKIKKLLEPRGNDFYIPIRKLIQQEALHTICFEMLRPFGFSSAQIPDVLALLDAESGRYVSSTDFRIIRNRDFLIITKNETAETDFILIDAFPKTIETETAQFLFKTSKMPENPTGTIEEIYLDLQEINQPLILRKWRTGDYFYPLGMGMKKKKLSRFFIDQKLPLHEKENVWILESNKRIAWVCGMRIDERFKIKPTTKQALKVVMKRG